MYSRVSTHELATLTLTLVYRNLLQDHHIEHMDCLNHLAMIWCTETPKLGP